jgi:catalase-peroxidase
MVLTGNVALASMSFKTFGFAEGGGREDVWMPYGDCRGPEKHWLTSERLDPKSQLKGTLGDRDLTKNQTRLLSPNSSAKSSAHGHE